MSRWQMKLWIFKEECQDYVKRRLRPFGSKMFHIHTPMGFKNQSKLVKFMELEKGLELKHLTFFDMYFIEK